MLSRFKPAASRKTLIFAAALFWTLVGAMLLWRGAAVLGRGGHFFHLAAGLLIGTGKGLLIFQRSAERNITRILARQDGSCLGAVFSFRSWGLILVMVAGGRFLRLVGLSPIIYSLALVAVGWGLLLASRPLWRQWSVL
ncbi:MAG: hypothetical protein ACOY4H_01430 [Thermodesulfobacteriota bacterium]